MCTCMMALGPRSNTASRALPGLAKWLGLGPKPAPARREIRLERVCVVNPGAGRIPDATLVVRDGVIACIEPSSEGDRSGPPRRFVLPGLVDLHTHALPGAADLFARLELMHGVTSVRNTGGDASLFAYKRAVANGERAAPRIFAGGWPLDGAPTAFPPPFAGPALDTPERGRHTVHRLAEQGADHIKVFINLTPSVLAAIRAEAAEHGLPVIGHIPRFSRLEDAGVVDVQHLTGIPEGPTTAFAVDGSFQPWLEAWPEVGRDRRARVADTSLEQGIAHTATLVLWKGLARCADPGMERPATEGLLPDAWVEGFWNTRRPPAPYVKGVNARVLDAVGRAWPHMLETVAGLREAGVAVLAGTDVVNPWIVPGLGLHEELALLVGCGFEPEETLALATREAGERLGVEGLGRLEAGAPADLMVLREDPTRDLAALGTLETVVADGRPYDVAALRDEQAAFCERFSGAVPRLLAGLGGAALAAVYSALPATAPERPLSS